MGMGSLLMKSSPSCLPWTGNCTPAAKPVPDHSNDDASDLSPLTNATSAGWAVDMHCRQRDIHSDARRRGEWSVIRVQNSTLAPLLSSAVVVGSTASGG